MTDIPLPANPRERLRHHIAHVILDAAATGLPIVPGEFATEVLALVDKAGVLVFVPEGGGVRGSFEVLTPFEGDYARAALGLDVATVGTEEDDEPCVVHEVRAVDLAKEWWQRKAEAAGWVPPEGES